MTKTLSFLLALCALGSVAGGEDAPYARYATAELAKLPVKGTPLFDGADLKGFSVGGSYVIVAAEGQPFGNAIRVEVPAAGKQAWDMQMFSPKNVAPIRRGDVLFLVLNVRCLSSDDPSGTGTYGAYLQRTTPPWTAPISINDTATSQWQRVYAAGVADRDFAPGDLSLAVHLSYHAQKLEFGGVMILNLGRGVDMAKLPYTPRTYGGREQDAPWRKAAAGRIERYRKGDMVVSVVDGAGKPVAGAEVHVQMKRHAFGFGSFIESSILGDTPEAQKYREWTLRLFNRATTPIYWADWGWANERVRKEYHGIAQWLQDNGLTTRGHVIIYPGWQFMPAATRKLEKDPAALRQALLDHIADVVQATSKYGFDEYDVTNELRQLHDLTDILGYEGVAEWFRTARKYNTTARLALNENTIVENGGKTAAEQAHFEKMIQLLLDAKAGPDVIGIQGHFGDSLTAPDRVVEILDRFARFGKPIHITEFDIDIRDEAAQGDYMRDFMTAVFSHPSVEAFTQWGFWEGRHWKPLCAMIRKDWTPKPNGQAYMDLVFKQWWTDVHGKTAADGTYDVRGFLGDYQIMVTTGGRSATTSVKLPAAGNRFTIKLE
ncbi:MAG: endo-1,4-beta-xylanase [Tepidisphaeraceae bacterium]|jgi:endo-1,4-beta-xylanase